MFKVGVIFDLEIFSFLSNVFRFFLMYKIMLVCIIIVFDLVLSGFKSGKFLFKWYVCIDYGFSWD